MDNKEILKQLMTPGPTVNVPVKHIKVKQQVMEVEQEVLHANPSSLTVEKQR